MLRNTPDCSLFQMDPPKFGEADHGAARWAHHRASLCNTFSNKLAVVEHRGFLWTAANYLGVERLQRRHWFPGWKLEMAGSSADRTRTYNPPVNSRLLYH